jgi:hypothetical protein
VTVKLYYYDHYLDGDPNCKYSIVAALNKTWPKNVRFEIVFGTFDKDNFLKMIRHELVESVGIIYR